MPRDDLRAMGENAAALASEYSPENGAGIVMDCLSVAACYARETR